MPGGNMNGNWDYIHCISVLKSEITLIKGISAIQDKVRQAVINREWTEFDEKMQEINNLSKEFTLLEDERLELFSSLAISSTGYTKNEVSEELWDAEEKPFYTLIMDLPSEARHELSYLYRELKMEVFKMRALNETFLAYLDEAKTLASAYIEAVCPARGGKLYTKRGRKVSQDLRSIVFNNRF